MARIESTAIGAGRKSLGNITYRYVNGRTIASRRVTTNNSRTPLQVKQRQGFSATVKLAKALNSLIRIGFEKSKSGSPYNQFMKHNRDYIDYVKSKPDYDLNLPAITNLCNAISDTDFTGKVTIANGSLNLTNVFSLSAGDKLTGTMYLGRDFAEGDCITLAICYSYKLVGSDFESIQLYDKILTLQDINTLTVKNQFEINETTFPNIELDGSLPEGSTEIKRVITVILSSEKDRSYSIIQPFPMNDEDEGSI